jgi:hypothetical protein
MTNGVIFLSNKPAFAGMSTAGASLSANSRAAVVLNDEVTDTWAGHQPLGGSPQDYYCQDAGWYTAEATVPFVYTAGTVFSFGALIGVTTGGTQSNILGGQNLTNSGQSPAVFAADLVQMTAAGPAGSASTDFAQVQGVTTGSGITFASAAPNIPVLALRWASSGTASSVAAPANAAFPGSASAAWLNANIRDALAFLTDPPVLRYTAPGTQVLASQSWATSSTISLSSKTVDNYGAWNAGSQAFVCPQPGIHYVIAQVTTTSNSGHAGGYAAGVSVNGTAYWGNSVYTPSNAGTVSCACADRFRLNQGDTVQLIGFQGSTGNVTVLTPTKLACLWESS